MSNRLLIITGERSGLDAVLPSIESLPEYFQAQIRIVSPDYCRVREPLRSQIKLPSFNGIRLESRTLRDYFTAFTNIVRYAREGDFTDILFVDNPDFNLLLARALSRDNLNLYYYIIPQIWAWRRYRIKYLRRYFKKIFVIFPFEKEYLKSGGIDSVYVGHPAIKSIEDVPPQEEILKKLDLTSNSKIISLFPGTRPNVLKRHFPLFRQAAIMLSSKLDGYRFIISDTNGMGRDTSKNIIYSSLSARELLSISDFAIISSGSTTMEATLLLRPFIGVYKPDLLTYNIGKMLLKNTYTVMPNIILNRQIIPEIISPKLTAEEIVENLLPILQRPTNIMVTIDSLTAVKKILTEYHIDRTLTDEIKDILT